MSEKLPDIIEALRTEHPDVWDAYTKLGDAASSAGPLDKKTQRLVKLALALGAREQGAVHSHARRAMRQGVTRDELLHVAFLGITTLGWPHATAGRSWILDIVEPKE
ncbi:MAG: carboxymuconolactone decarboxylase family protein [Candidatus Latescibacterota bacterium]|nr:MAG: carboxymuconolactone decarboxylase family protein [Candidatus Latescibacterota bacterium]